MADRSTIVVKIGGSTLGAHDTSLEDVVELQRGGRPTVVVHGGGPAITGWLTRLQTPSQFVRGLRVTDATALEVVVGVLAGLVNKQLVAELSARGARVMGLSGADGHLLNAVYENEELGFVGRIVGVNPGPLQALLAAGYVPLVAPLALLTRDDGSPEPQLLNVNADTVAGELAAALMAERLIFLTDVDGVRGERGEAIARIDARETQTLLTSGVISGGMIPKVEAALRAVESGTTAVIVDGRRSHSLLAALAEAPSGTLIVGSQMARTSSGVVGPSTGSG